MGLPSSGSRNGMGWIQKCDIDLASEAALLNTDLVAAIGPSGLNEVTDDGDNLDSNENEKTNFSDDIRFDRRHPN
jgi:uncharacterized protein CbrC (UPF0167 family)